MWVDGDLRGGGGDVLLADAAGDVDPVEQDAVAFELRLKRDAGMAGQVEQGRFLVEGEVVFDGFQRKGAVHGPGFEVEEAEAAGEMGGEGAFARASGAVDGDDGPLAFGAAQAAELRGKASFGGATFFRFEFTRRSPFPKGFLLPLNLSKVLTGLPEAVSGRFAIRLLAGEAAATGFSGIAAARFSVGLLRSETAGGLACVAAGAFAAGTCRTIRRKGTAGRSPRSEEKERVGRSPRSEEMAARDGLRDQRCTAGRDGRKLDAQGDPHGRKRGGTDGRRLGDPRRNAQGGRRGVRRICGTAVRCVGHARRPTVIAVAREAGLAAVAGCAAFARRTRAEAAGFARASEGWLVAEGAARGTAVAVALGTRGELAARGT